MKELRSAIDNKLSQELIVFFNILFVVSDNLENCTEYEFEINTDKYIDVNLKSTNNKRLNLNIYAAFKKSKFPYHFQLNVLIEKERIEILNTTNYGDPSISDLEDDAKFFKDFLKSKIDLVGYYDKKGKLYYKKIEYSIGDVKYRHMLKKEFCFIFKKLERKILVKFVPWLAPNEEFMK